MRVRLNRALDVKVKDIDSKGNPAIIEHKEIGEVIEGSLLRESLGQYLKSGIVEEVKKVRYEFKGSDTKKNSDNS